MKRIIESESPAVFKALETICHDNGFGAGWLYHLVREDDTLPVYEKVLSELTEEELQTFCIGEESESQDIADRSDEHKATHEFLLRFFDEYLQDDYYE